MSTPWRSAAASLDLATAVCAALNLAYFLYRLSPAHDSETVARRLAALALALVSLGALVESLFFLVSLTAAPGSPLASLPWTLARVLPFAGTAFISLLILRRLTANHE